MHQYLVLTSKGLEGLLEQELHQLGLTDTRQTVTGVWINANIKDIYKVCLWSRLGTRVLYQLTEGKVESAEDLYQLTQQVPWHETIREDASIAVDFVGTNRAINNSQFGALKVKDAIVDMMLEKTGKRPFVERKQPDLGIQCRLRNNKLGVFIDLSGPSLQQRGYRKEQGKAPLKEHLAAAMVMRSGFLGSDKREFVDGFCGSGTIVIEAAQMAANMAPGLSREYWGFRGWIGHRDKPWKEALDQAKAALTSLDGYRFFGSDTNPKLIDKARENAERAGVADAIVFRKADATSIKPNGKSELVSFVSNVPYGERIGELPVLLATFFKLGNSLKTHFGGASLTLLTADEAQLRGLKLVRKRNNKLQNGPLDCVLNHYEVEFEDVSQLSGDFANRLKKSAKQIDKWARQQELEAYRVYDADLPEYNVAIDRYADHLVIQEYAPPKSIDPVKARQRLLDVILQAPEVLGVEPHKVHLKVREQQKGKNQYQVMDKSKNELEVREHNARLLVNLDDYLDTGLFLDHRKTRQLVAGMAEGKRVLNLFAYTGSVSVFCALAGAETVTTVDMSRTYLNWAKDNFKLNRLTGRRYDFVQADCLQWIEDGDETFDLIFIDPPTFSNSKRMDKSFDVQRDHVQVLTSLVKRLSEDGVIVFTNNKRHFKMDLEALAQAGLYAECLSKKTLPKDFSRNPHIHNSWKVTRR